MQLQLYLKLSVMMFLEYAIWGAWYPVLAARLVGPLKMNSKQTGWIFATLPLSCIISPLVAGHLADKYINTELILAGTHLIGALLLFIAAWRIRFTSLFVVMLLYAFCYAATLPLVNSLMFHQLTQVFETETSVDTASAKIFIWAPIAWALAGYFLTAIRLKFKTGTEGKDCLILSAVLSVIMAVACSLLPHTPPAKSGGAPILRAFQMLGDPTFLIFIVISIVAAGLMQFYFKGTAPFMQDVGIRFKNVPAYMAIAKLVQTLATFFVLGVLLSKFGFKWTLVLGAASWLLLYAIYIAAKPWWLIIVAQSLHGLAYVFFIIAGQIFTKSVASKEILSSMQALIFTATMGIGLFLGTQFAGVVMDRFRRDDKFQWRSVFLVPCLIMFACVLALVLFFRP